MVIGYQVTAEFYDVLHADVYQQAARRILGRWLNNPTLGVLDVGAGTGIATEVIAGLCDVQVHAVEPARPMRIALLTRLASNPKLSKRVTVHAGRLHEVGLSNVADFALCLNVVPNMSSIQRRATFAALAEAVVPAGRLVLQPPFHDAPVSMQVMPVKSIGEDDYCATVEYERVGMHGLRWHFKYEVRRHGVLLRESSEVFVGNLVDREKVIAELARVGFRLVAEDGDLMIGERIASPDPG